MKSFTHEPIEFSVITALSAADSTRAKAGLAFFGMNRIVGHLRLQMSLREGKSSPEALDRGVATEGSGEGGGFKHFLICEDLWEMATRLEQWWQMYRF